MQCSVVQCSVVFCCANQYSETQCSAVLSVEDIFAIAGIRICLPGAPMPVFKSRPFFQTRINNPSGLVGKARNHQLKMVNSLDYWKYLYAYPIVFLTKGIAFLSLGYFLNLFF